jgi:DNA polymerase I-like protein with 3'-5' exonuclease and polymerase domains
MVDVLGWEEQNTDELYTWLSSNNLKKGDMHLAPFSLIGPYNALDADATYQLYKYLVEVLNSRFIPEIRDTIIEYHRQDSLTMIDLLIEQQIAGIHVNLEKLATYEQKLILNITRLRDKFLELDEVQLPLQYLRRTQIDHLTAAEPERLTKTGVRTKRHEAWERKCQELRDLPDHELFNVDSPKQLIWLLVDQLGYKTPRVTEKGDASVDNKSLSSLGEPGRVLARYRKLRDKLKFVTAIQNIQQDGILHPSLTMAGTSTGRMSGGNQA